MWAHYIVDEELGGLVGIFVLASSLKVYHFGAAVDKRKYFIFALTHRHGGPIEVNRLPSSGRDRKGLNNTLSLVTTMFGALACVAGINVCFDGCTHVWKRELAGYGVEGFGNAPVTSGDVIMMGLYDFGDASSGDEDEFIFPEASVTEGVGIDKSFFLVEKVGSEEGIRSIIGGPIIGIRFGNGTTG